MSHYLIILLSPLLFLAVAILIVWYAVRVERRTKLKLPSDPVERCTAEFERLKIEVKGMDRDKANKKVERLAHKYNRVVDDWPLKNYCNELTRLIEQ